MMAPTEEFTPLWTTFDIVSEDGTTMEAGKDTEPTKRGSIFSMFSRGGSSASQRGEGSGGPPVRLKSHHTIGRKELSSPSGLTLYSSAGMPLLAVGDEKNNRVVVLDLHSGAPQLTISGTQKHTLTHPSGVAVDDANGVIYVVAAAESKVRAYKLEGAADSAEPLCSSSGSGDSKLKYAEACTLLAGKLFVADREHHRVVAFETADLSFIGAFGKKGNGHGQFNQPRGLCPLPCESKDEMVIADTNNDRLVILRTNGDVLGTLGGPGNKAGQFCHPIGVAATAFAIYVSDEGNGRLQVLSRSGAPLQIVSFGRLTSPPPLRGVCCGSGVVCVVTGDKVRVFDERVSDSSDPMLA